MLFDQYEEAVLRRAMMMDIANDNMIKEISSETRYMMSRFWHKTRKEFPKWTAEEIALRSCMSIRDTLTELNLMSRRKLSFCSGAREGAYYCLTPFGEAIAMSELQKEGLVEPYMSQSEFRDIRNKLQMTRDQVAEMLKVETFFVLNYERGAMAVPFNVAERMKTASRRRNC